MVMSDQSKSIVATIKYVNSSGVVSNRRIIPNSIWFGAIGNYGDAQWFLIARDLDRDEIRYFAQANIQSWKNGG